MSNRPFVHLHCHSHYSLLDGASSIPKLVQRTADHGMNALALTDHGNMHGALEFYRACKSKDINPIIGYEAYIAPGSRKSKSGGKGKDSSYHLTLLCQNATGFKNLVKMASHASLDGFYFKPRIDKELLEEYNEGIICLSGCVSSEFSRAILRGSGNGAEESLAEAKNVAQWFHGVFGDRYFLEIMNNNVDIQKPQLQGAVEIAQQVGLPLVATSDCHYVDREDAEAQDVMLCINMGKFRTDSQRMKMEGDQFYLRPPEEMYRNFPGLEDAVARSQQIADTVDIQLELGERFFPVFDLPPDRSPEDELRDLCLKGLMDRYEGNEEMKPGGELAEVVMARLNRELGVINKLGFANYFLICWDFVEQARKRDIPSTARGSGVGAIVCYALYLSHVCPIKYSLLFERFLDENRLEAPDIDIDFCKERRGEIIRYVKEKYGEESVAQIGTFGTLKARAAIKDVGRVLGIPLTRVNQITSMVPDQLGISLQQAIDSSDELKGVYEGDPEIAELLEFALKLEGLARNIGTHAAAVVISDGPLTDFVPLGRVAGKEDVITQWSMNDVEAAGLLKMDFLGLRTLTILSNTVKLIQQTTGKTVDPLEFPLDDQPTFELLQSGDTKGVFQLESGGIRDLLSKMKPDHFRDIIATNALYRPGPLEGGMVQQYIDVKHGRREAEYKLDVLKEILEETNGVMVYQEQVMQILNRLGKIPLASAYTCIKAISKKKEKIIASNHDAYMSGAVEQGLSKKDAQEMWDMILKFAGYGFNKSHSTAYAAIAWQTAYLKAHYPVEFMAALLTGDIPGRNFTSKDSLVEHMEDCDRMGVEVVPPCINQSGVEFTVANGKIHFAMSAVKGCGGSAAAAIAEEREANGPFKDIFDFCERIESSKCNRSAIETLIKAGAMDCFEVKRSQLSAVTDRALQAGAAMMADKKSGQKNLFGGDDEDEAEDAEFVFPEMDEWEERALLTAEKEVLGFYLTSHPLAQFEAQLARYCSHKTSGLEGTKDRDRVSLGGMISAVKQSHVKNPRDANSPTKYAMFDLEDVEGAIRCILWPQDFAKHGDAVVSDAIVVLQGRLDYRGGDEANMIVDKVIPIDQLDENLTHGIKVMVDQQAHGVDGLKTVYEIIRGYPGNRQLKFEIILEDGMRVEMNSNRKVEISEQLTSRLTDLLGKTSVEMLIDRKALSAKAEPKKWGKR
ncbi:MAG: DNA polymerase III subunit alpha [Mariniblastus sp.]|nr:DNA polymerase III subunit alpha [Mariniblastus sp.]MDC0265886.1 DNA polymerase III subunit alpha [Mariniblastus sp.]MDC3256109.1 DNA polymerase III subunit alpha [bacterium]MDG1512324.1 DNA polymerase III subunit alpha [Mariniblastus sp.]MDG2181135.1 DNA polymerase III subunit alpha [Mariniblastus sp.]